MQRCLHLVQKKKKAERFKFDSLRDCSRLFAARLPFAAVYRSRCLHSRERTLLYPFIHSQRNARAVHVKFHPRSRDRYFVLSRLHLLLLSDPRREICARTAMIYLFLRCRRPDRGGDGNFDGVTAASSSRVLLPNVFYSRWSRGDRPRRGRSFTRWTRPMKRRGTRRRRSKRAWLRLRCARIDATERQREREREREARSGSSLLESNAVFSRCTDAICTRSGFW